MINFFDLKTLRKWRSISVGLLCLWSGTVLAKTTTLPHLICADYLGGYIQRGATALSEILASGHLENREARCLAQQFETLCKDSHNTPRACVRIVAEIHRLREKIIAEATEEIQAWTERLLTIASDQAAVPDSFYQILESCENEPLHPDCRKVVSSLQSLFVASAKSPTELDLAAQRVDSAIEGITYFSDEVRHAILTNIRQTRRHPRTQSRYWEKAHLLSYPKVDMDQVLAQILQTSKPTIVTEGTKVVVESANAKFRIVLDPYLPYFTIRWFDGKKWLKCDQWEIESNGTLHRAGENERAPPGTRMWGLQTHFIY